MQAMPLVGDMKSLHNDIPVGSEAQEYVDERARLDHELGKINHAKQGLIQAFDITDAELVEYELVEYENIEDKVGGVATCFLPSTFSRTSPTPSRPHRGSR